MSIAELEMKKARLARKILNEKDENIIVLIGENLRKMKRNVTAIDTNKREKLVKDYLEFVEENSISVPNFKFNRENCYDRQIFLR